MSRSNTDETMADGGQPDQGELFDHLEGDVSVDVSRRERLFRTIDAYVFAPARVASNDWRAVIGIFTILGFFGTGILGPILVNEPKLNEGDLYVQPFQNMQYPLGTDGLGQSIGEQLVHATPAMVKMVVAGAIVSIGIATFIGVTSGYKGGKIDRVMMVATDIVLTIPGLPLIIVIASVYPPEDPFIVGMLLAIDNWPGLARSLRSQVLSIREESYIEASRTMGLNSRTVLERDIIPQVMPYILINSANAARSVIFESVALYFLGILPFTTFNWGVMMNLAYRTGGALTDFSHAHWLYMPALCIFILSFGLTMFAQGMDRVFNPRLRAKHAKSVGGDGEAEVE